MEIKSSYFLKAAESGKASIHSVYSGGFTTHCDNQYPALPTEIAEILCEDLNEINLRNFKRANKMKNTEAAIEKLHNEFLANELIESLSYCVLSTILERNWNAIELEFHIHITQHIHKDRLFRVNPQPPMFQNEMAIVDLIKPHFSVKWNDLPLNYASTLEEIEQGEYGFVNEQIINDLLIIISKFDNTEVFVINLLFQYIDSFSITLPILWIGKLITNETFVDAYRVFVFEQPIAPASKKQKEQRQYFINRMTYLRKTIESIKNIDTNLIR
jgi:hypothetical protein